VTGHDQTSGCRCRACVLVSLRVVLSFDGLSVGRRNCVLSVVFPRCSNCYFVSLKRVFLPACFLHPRASCGPTLALHRGPDKSYSRHTGPNGPSVRATVRDCVEKYTQYLPVLGGSMFSSQSAEYRSLIILVWQTKWDACSSNELHSVKPHLGYCSVSQITYTVLVDTNPA